MRHTWNETLSGLKRNMSMTIAVVMTMWVSLTLFGIGVLTNQQVDKLKGTWYDKIQVAVYLCTPTDKTTNCQPGQDTTDAQKTAIRTALETNPDVEKVYFETKADAYKEYKKLYANSSLENALTEKEMPESFRVKLKNPETYASVRTSVGNLPGVAKVQDLHKLLDPFFRWLNIAKWATIGASALLLLAAALQISNTIRMAAFARRRELGIMRLVGASNWYIMLPFLLESLLSALIGAALSGVTMFVLVYWLIVQKAQVSIKTVGWIGLPETGIAFLWVASVAIVLSIIPTLIATRKYLRV